MNNISEKPIIIWGQSLGGAFATMTASERQEKVKRAINKNPKTFIQLFLRQYF